VRKATWWEREQERERVVRCRGNRGRAQRAHGIRPGSSPRRAAHSLGILPRSQRRGIRQDRKNRSADRAFCAGFPAIDSRLECDAVRDAGRPVTWPNAVAALQDEQLRNRQLLAKLDRLNIRRRSRLAEAVVPRWQCSRFARENHSGAMRAGLRQGWEGEHGPPSTA